MKNQKAFVKVTCPKSGNDWSDYITNFKYEDCTDKANMLEIRFSDNYALSVIDSPDFQEKSILEIQWGYAGGEISKVHRAVVQDIDAKYAQSITCTIRCLDKTKTINSAGVTVLWENKKSSQIAEEIAKKYELEVQIDSTDTVWPSLPQSNETDFDFLKRLAKREKNGNFESFIRGNTLYFRKKPVGEKATWTVQYGDDDFIEFSPRNRNSTKKTSDDGVKIVGVDSFNKEVLIDMVGTNNLTDQTDLGVEGSGMGGKLQQVGTTVMEKMNTQKIANQVYNANGDKVMDEVAPPTTVVGGDGLSSREKKNLGNNIVKKGQDNKNTGTLTVVGNPSFEAGQIVTIKRVAKKHAGNWYITKVETLIDSAGYKTSCELTRSASAKGTTKNKVNTTEGKKSDGSEGSKTKQVRTYDVNGTEVK